MIRTSQTNQQPEFPSFAATISNAFEGFGFMDNLNVNNGIWYNPPDPMAAAGTDRLVAVGNRMIEMRDKTGTLIVPFKSLQDFFSSLGGAPITLETRTFDPKIIFDFYEERFVVVALEKTDDTDSEEATDESRILIAVSKTTTPATLTATDWNYHAIDSKIDIDLGEPDGIVSHWADYPGFEADEEAVYITANMYSFVTNGRKFGGVRLWIVNKGIVGGFYNGGPTSVTVHDPYSSAGMARPAMPAQVYGAGGIPGGAGNIGTFLVSYSLLTNNTVEFVQLVRVDDPLGTTGGPVFTQEYIVVGSIEDKTFPVLPDAPQLGCSELICVNDRRALDAVWRDNVLWFTTTILPETGPDVGQATAHWFKLSTSAVPGGAITLVDQGNIGGEDIAPTTSTFFPSVAVNSAGDAKFGFSASAPTIYAGAYVTGRDPLDASGTVRPSRTVKAGEDVFNLNPGGGNRWGDYSSISLDPSDDTIFWVFNEFADISGAGGCENDGRWGTAYASCTMEIIDLSPPISVNLAPPPGQAVIIPLNLSNPDALPIDNFGLTFSYPTNLLTFQNIDVIGTLTDGWSTISGQENTPGILTLTGSNGESISSSGILLNVEFQETGGPGNGSLQLRNFLNDIVSATTTDGTLNDAVPVELASFSARVLENTVVLEWSTISETNNFGFEIQKGFDEKNFNKIGFIAGNDTESSTINYRFNDSKISSGVSYYRLKQIDTDGSFLYSEILKVEKTTPKYYVLNQNFPNPFNPTTSISYQLAEDTHVSIKIYNGLGQEIKTLVDENKTAASYSIYWDGRDNLGNPVVSGVYLYQIHAGNYFCCKKLILMK